MRRLALQAGRKGTGYETCSTESPAMIDLTQCVVGVDLGDRKSLACVYAQRVVIGWFEFEMTREAVQAAFEGKGSLRVALEAGEGRARFARRWRPLTANCPRMSTRKWKDSWDAGTRKKDLRGWNVGLAGFIGW